MPSAAHGMGKKPASLRVLDAWPASAVRSFALRTNPRVAALQCRLAFAVRVLYDGAVSAQRASASILSA
jgi:hypothetical protein